MKILHSHVFLANLPFWISSYYEWKTLVVAKDID